MVIFFLVFLWSGVLWLLWRERRVALRRQAQIRAVRGTTAEIVPQEFVHHTQFIRWAPKRAHLTGKRCKRVLVILSAFCLSLPSLLLVFPGISMATALAAAIGCLALWISYIVRALDFSRATREVKGLPGPATVEEVFQLQPLSTNTIQTKAGFGWPKH